MRPAARFPLGRAIQDILEDEGIGILVGRCTSFASCTAVESSASAWTPAVTAGAEHVGEIVIGTTINTTGSLQVRAAKVGWIAPWLISAQMAGSGSSGAEAWIMAQALSQGHG